VSPRKPRSDRANAGGNPAPFVTATQPADPRAIRASVGGAVRIDGDPSIVAGPVGAGPIGPVGPPGLVDPLAPAGRARLDDPVGRSEPMAADIPEPPTQAGMVNWLVDGKPTRLRYLSGDPAHAVLERENGVPTRLLLGAARRRERDGLVLREVIVDGWRVEVKLELEARAVLRDRARRARTATVAGVQAEIHAIIPGRIVVVSVAPGEGVQAGQPLLVLEAMKMQNELRAPREGTVERVAVAVGDNVEVGDLLFVIR